MQNPYTRQGDKAFWRKAVSEVSPLEFKEMFTPRWEIEPATKVATAGSCFAQHIGAQFRKRGLGLLDAEPAPDLLAWDRRAEFGYGLYSARYGNVYTVRQLLQLAQRALGEFRPAEWFWPAGDTVVDPFRPTIQPGGFASREELERDLDYHLGQVRWLLSEADVFIFTFGLTEGWINRADGAALPMCPGTVAGTWDESRYAFVNYQYDQVVADAESFFKLARSINPEMRFILTVSPVPLTATATDQHALVASTYSKAVLRAACGALRERNDFVDYFPSFELVASHPMRAMFFDPNLRTVSPVGVAHVMETFFGAYGGLKAQPKKRAGNQGPKQQRRRNAQKNGRWQQGRKAGSDETICDEAILDEFGS